MTREETKRLLGRIRAAWPYFCRGMKDEQLREVVDVWAEALADYSEGYIDGGFKRHLARCRFAPTVAELLAGAEEQRKAKPDILDMMGGYTSGGFAAGAKQAGEDSMAGTLYKQRTGD